MTSQTRLQTNPVSYVSEGALELWPASLFSKTDHKPPLCSHFDVFLCCNWCWLGTTLEISIIWRKIKRFLSLLFPLLARGPATVEVVSGEGQTKAFWFWLSVGCAKKNWCGDFVGAVTLWLQKLEALCARNRTMFWCSCILFSFLLDLLHENYFFLLSTALFVVWNAMFSVLIPGKTSHFFSVSQLVRFLFVRQLTKLRPVEVQSRKDTKLPQLSFSFWSAPLSTFIALLIRLFSFETHKWIFCKKRLL